ncbi:LOW QUALITY PROTEIN: transient receptor potential channel pyrexia-like [Diprion similis]|uniref:LOW QUALITY PROTEIN: transient receptor potential channel pyrexia-like n=1 Tax=Diprion similis TaxID=362088 RepID=UPI001EF7BBAC|nr:LOW QUALITY PROTEIN: transient receptor potential channel pyrexia-like [Diprion similis]
MSSITWILEELPIQYFHRTPLHLAACSGSVEIIEELLKHNSNPEKWDAHRKCTPLHCAAAAGDVKSVKLLLKSGANVDAGLSGNSMEHEKTPLHYAVPNEASDCVEELLRAGASPNNSVVYTETPLHVAASLGSARCVGLLLNYGADVRVQFGSARSTPLHLAAEEGSADCTKLLLEAGAPWDAQNSRGQSIVVGRFPMFGLYIQMFTQVAVNFFKFLGAYLCLRIGFSLGFTVICKDYKSFANPGVGLIKTIVMMSGELEFDDMFWSGENESIARGATMHVMFLVFVVLVTVILTNLLVGLAVSDIQELQRCAGLERLIRRAELVAHLESLLFSRLLDYTSMNIVRIFRSLPSRETLTEKWSLPLTSSSLDQRAITPISFVDIVRSGTLLLPGSGWILVSSRLASNRSIVPRTTTPSRTFHRVMDL